jgi:hypothetical protein
MGVTQPGDSRPGKPEQGGGKVSDPEKLAAGVGKREAVFIKADGR